ncbi:LPS export ABC transporter periplasmic protein LptC [Pleomorphomonas sp. JP5]|uniref:LPS export ABC transporter periplasmic protein LptC n=1 Tax=Pleomorphomonas sp. JP5 TaxID=2942998 RepID=UPI002042CD93|nr:LPS export ABC transporter periplasmic protein LptC [Pleomorphomonas sp. JP5]MCM5559586.1 LPS export ABC transporter periplasmic protein LptC [Pleomorphomonas sp. JP5]
MSGIAANRAFDGSDLEPFGNTAERARQFAMAARESRRVRRLRVILPAVGALLCLIVVGATVITRITISLSIGDLKITTEGLAMDAPHLSGSDGKGRTYAVSAESAVQDLGDTRIIRLKGIEATVTQADGSRARLLADSGVYDSAAQTVVLKENIRLSNSDGSGGALERAEINLSTGSLTSDSPVAFSSRLGEISAEKMGVEKKAGTVTFSGGVRMTVDPSAHPGSGDKALPSRTEQGAGGAPEAAP